MANSDKYTALYCRVSTEAQFEEGYSISAQTEMLQAYCKARQISNFKTFIDGGYSGSNLNRPDIQKIIEEAKKGRIDKVIVYKLDRVSRSQKDTMFLIEDVFLPNGVDFISINESFDTSTPFGRAMVGILSVFAQLERDNIKMRTRMGMLKRVEEGYWMGGGIVPFGYDYDRNNGILVPNSDAEKVRKMYDLYLSGYSCDRIAKLFELKYDKLVYQILTRKTNIGIITYNGKEYPGKHESIVSQEVYYETMKEMKRRNSLKVVTQGLYLFTGLLYCGKCGAKMRYQKWGKSGEVKVYCYSQQNSKPYLIKDPNCDCKRQDASIIEESILRDFFRHFDISRKKNTANTVTDALDLLFAKKQQLESKIRNLYVLFSDDPSDDLRKLIAERKTELNETETLITAEKEKLMETSQNRKLYNDFADLNSSWPYMTAQEQKGLLRSCIEKVLVFDDTVVVHYKI